MKIVIAGGTGFIGQRLTQTLRQRDHEVVVLTRGRQTTTQRVAAVTWDAIHAEGAWVAEVRGADAVVNLAGASIGGGRWTASRKRLLIESRIRSTQALVDAVKATGRPVALITASGIDYYGNHPGAEALDEHAPAGTSFLARLCVRWEEAALQAEPLGMQIGRAHV